MSRETPNIVRLPLLGAIKEISKSANRLDATIVTTFAFNGPFYEEVLLRSFERAGSRVNIVLVDARQLAESLADEMRRPRRAGRDYVLCSVENERAFHPKLLVLLSEKKLGFGVGSHNLTAAGFAHNEEVSTFWDLRDGAPITLVKSAVEYCLQRLQSAHTLSPSVFKDVAHRLRSLANAGAEGEAETSDCELALDGVVTLWSALERHITGRVRRAIVAGPYFDQDFGLLRRVSETFAPNELIVAIEPEMVLLGDPKRAPIGARFVDISIVTTAPKRRGDVRFSHAKLIALQTDNGWVVSTGSANPTKAGWGVGAGANAEANIILSGERAADAVAKLGLDRLADARAVTQLELTAAAKRSADQRRREREEQQDRVLSPLLQGRLEEGLIVVDRGFPKVDLSACELWSSAPELWANSYVFAQRDDAIEIRAQQAFSSGIYSVRCGGTVVAYIIVHDDFALRASSSSREGAQLLSSLGRIDQYEGFDEVFDLITRHVVDAEPQPRVAMEAQSAFTKKKEAEASDEDVPYGPRGVSLVDDRVEKSRTRLFAQGLVSDLLSALIASLHVTTAPSASATDGDAPDRDLEETKDDEESGEDIASNIEVAVPIKDVDWPRVVRACRQRTSTLVNRLKNKLENLEPEPSWELGKLLSVMCLVQKLRTLPPPPDMILDAAPQSLITWDHLQNLYVFAVNHVYGTGKLSERLAKVGGANAQERLLLDNQLLWYARELGFDSGRDVSTAADSECRDEVLQGRADLAVIAFSAAAGESELWLKERASILSRWDDSDYVARDWFQRHRAIGETLQATLARIGVAQRKAGAIKDGCYAIRKAEPRLPRVVRAVIGDRASLYEPGAGGEKKFLLSGLEGIDLSDQ